MEKTPSIRKASVLLSMSCRDHLELSGAEGMVHVFIYFVHRCVRLDIAAVSGACAMGADFAVVIIFCHGECLHFLVRHVHLHLVYGSGEVLVLPRVGDTHPECRIAVAVAHRVLFDLVFASMETDALFFIERDPVRVGEASAEAEFRLSGVSMVFSRRCDRKDLGTRFPDCTGEDSLRYQLVPTVAKDLESREAVRG